MLFSMDVCCGYAAAALACLAFGSFAVPIKASAAAAAAAGSQAVDPLVLQTYKIFCCFVTSMLVILCTPTLRDSFVFTPWGIMSGLFMVPGGTAGYWAVQSAGLAVSQGIWSSLKVLVAFGWGILIFKEDVVSISGTVAAVLLLMVGLAGMSYYAAPQQQSSAGSGENNEININNDETLDQPLLLLLNDAEAASGTTTTPPSPSTKQRNPWGILGAVIDGLYGGSILVPMHFASAEATEGLAYIGSFAIGCLIVVGGVWSGRFLLHSAQLKSFADGYACLPSLHITTVGPYATLAGLIWSAGNMFSIVSVALLGEGVGYSVVQSQLLVAGLWGILLFKEVRGIRAITRWFAFAMLTVIGIVLISQQHVEMSEPADEA